MMLLIISSSRPASFRISWRMGDIFFLLVHPGGHQLGKAADGSQGGLQLMGHVGGEVPPQLFPLPGFRDVLDDQHPGGPALGRSEGLEI